MQDNHYGDLGAQGDRARIRGRISATCKFEAFAKAGQGSRPLLDFEILRSVEELLTSRRTHFRYFCSSKRQQ